MKRYIEGKDRGKMAPLPASLDDFVGEDNQVRVIDPFVVELSLRSLGFVSAPSALTGRPG